MVDGGGGLRPGRAWLAAQAGAMWDEDGNECGGGGAPSLSVRGPSRQATSIPARAASAGPRGHTPDARHASASRVSGASIPPSAMPASASASAHRRPNVRPATPPGAFFAATTATLARWMSQRHTAADEEGAHGRSTAAADSGNQRTPSRHRRRAPASPAPPHGLTWEVGRGAAHTATTTAAAERGRGAAAAAPARAPQIVPGGQPRGHAQRPTPRGAGGGGSPSRAATTTTTTSPTRHARGHGRAPSSGGGRGYAGGGPRAASPGAARSRPSGGQAGAPPRGRAGEAPPRSPSRSPARATGSFLSTLRAQIEREESAAREKEAEARELRASAAAAREAAATAARGADVDVDATTLSAVVDATTLSAVEPRGTSPQPTPQGQSQPPPSAVVADADAAAVAAAWLQRIEELAVGASAPAPAATPPATDTVGDPRALSHRSSPAARPSTPAKPQGLRRRRRGGDAADDVDANDDGCTGMASVEVSPIRAVPGGGSGGSTSGSASESGGAAAAAEGGGCVVLVNPVHLPPAPDVSPIVPHLTGTCSVGGSLNSSGGRGLLGDGALVPPAPADTDSNDEDDDGCTGDKTASRRSTTPQPTDAAAVLPRQTEVDAGMQLSAALGKGGGGGTVYKDTHEDGHGDKHTRGLPQRRGGMGGGLAPARAKSGRPQLAAAGPHADELARLERAARSVAGASVGGNGGGGSGTASILGPAGVAGACERHIDELLEAFRRTRAGDKELVAAMKAPPASAGGAAAADERTRPALHTHSKSAAADKRIRYLEKRLRAAHARQEATLSDLHEARRGARYASLHARLTHDVYKNLEAAVARSMAAEARVRRLEVANAELADVARLAARRVQALEQHARPPPPC